MKKVKILLPIVIISIIVIATIIGINMKKSEFINLSKKEYSENIKNPDRIIYKSENEDEYYEILPEEDLYNKIINKVSKNIGKLDQDIDISQEDIDKIHKDNTYIEFDYNTISKNFIIPFNIEGKGIIKLKTEGATLLSTEIKDIKNISNLVRKEVKQNKKKTYTMNTNKEYISTNIFATFPYKYKQQFKEIDYMVYQTVITNWEDYELYRAMCNLHFNEQLPENIFENNNLILTVSTPQNVSVKAEIGNLKYTYDDKNATTYGYHAHLFKVSKIVNSNCIYNTNIVIGNAEKTLQDAKESFDTEVKDIEKEVFVTNFDEYKSEKSENKISEEKAKEIADKGFDEAKRIAGGYDKDTQTVKKEEVYSNNFFIRKSDEADKEYSKLEAYVFCREDSLGNGVQVYVDVNTGKIIGGEAFGD